MQQLCCLHRIRLRLPSFGLGQKKEGGAAKKILSIFGLRNLKKMGQLTLAQRYQIQSCLDNAMSKSETAQYIGKDKSVIYREVKRNCDGRNGAYKAELAHHKATTRHKTKRKKIYFTDIIKAYVEGLLVKDYSPEQIVGRARLEGVAIVSVERIYQHIWTDKKNGGTLHRHLRSKGKRYRKRGASKDSRGLLQDRVDIDMRPTIVDRKERFGDLEIDLVLGKDHKGALLTINDRATGILFMTKVASKHSEFIEEATIALLDDWKPLIHTITSDNGKEFANHKNIAQKLDLNFYFAKPYHSWQRGANENLNGLVRQYFPKGSDFSNIKQHELNQVQNTLNNRPRKRFGYKSPNEMLAQKIDQIGSVAFIH